MTSPIILALDTSDIDIARKWIETTSSTISTYKIGLEFFLKFGAEGVHALRESGNFDLFLDLKLHDIPQTVSGAARSIAELNPKFLTVHAAGGPNMVSAAVSVLPDTSITAVTVLTSLSDQDVLELGFAHSAMRTAELLAISAVRAGASSIVCSPLEIGAIRNVIPASVKIITPGVRPLGSESGDQMRTMTPAQAVRAGADFVVIGRPITQFWKESQSAMAVAAKHIADSLQL